MSHKKPISKWIKAIAIILATGLIYVVYFTELGKPLSSESDHSSTIYDQTAVPTLFVKWRPVPIVKLDWAHADQYLLKFSLKIYELPANTNPADWICDPYTRIDESVPYTLARGASALIHDASGEAVQFIYEYEIDAGNLDSLNIDVDLTIGPCADYLNFQETNATPAVIPELVGNYHLRFQVPVNTTASSPLTPQSTAMAVWENIPVYPGALEVKDDTAGYHYSLDKIGPHTVMRFYRNQMQDTDWELLSIADIGGPNISSGYTLSYIRGKEFLNIDIFIKRKITHVILNKW